MKKLLLSICICILSLMLSSCSLAHTELDSYYDEIKEEYDFEYSHVLFKHIIKEGNEKILQEEDEMKRIQLIHDYKMELYKMILSPEEKEYIIDSYINSYMYDEVIGTEIGYYFGNYSGKYVYIIRWYVPNICVSTIIGDYEFENSATGFVFVTYEGETTILSDAYYKGIISDEELDDIAKKYDVVYRDCTRK